jgi:hypothetical protein
LIHLKALSETLKGPTHIKEVFKQFTDAVQCSLELRKTQAFQSIRGHSLREVDLKEFSKEGSLLRTEVDKILLTPKQRTTVSTQLTVNHKGQANELAKFERLSALEGALNEYMAELKQQLKDLYHEHRPPGPLETPQQYEEVINSTMFFAGRFTFDERLRPQLPDVSKNSDPRVPNSEASHRNRALSVTIGLCVDPRFESKANKLLNKINAVGGSLNALKDKTEIDVHLRDKVRKTVDTCYRFEPTWKEKKLLDKITDIISLGIKPLLKWFQGDSTQKLQTKTEDVFKDEGLKPKR